MVPQHDNDSYLFKPNLPKTVVKLTICSARSSGVNKTWGTLELHMDLEGLCNAWDPKFLSKQII